MEDFKQKHPTLHKHLFTVTIFSKVLATILFISLPFLGFYLGMRYQERTSLSLDQEVGQVTPKVEQKIIISPTINPTEIVNWKTYISKLGFSLIYPNDWEVMEDSWTVNIELCDMNKLHPSEAPVANTIFGEFGCFTYESPDPIISPDKTIVLYRILNIENNSLGKITLFYLNNPENLSIKNFEDKYLRNGIQDSPHVWSSNFKEIKNLSGDSGYYGIGGSGPVPKIEYIWGGEDKIFILSYGDSSGRKYEAEQIVKNIYLNFKFTK